jgi:hypothetical protein
MYSRFHITETSAGHSYNGLMPKPERDVRLSPRSRDCWATHSQQLVQHHPAQQTSTGALYWGYGKGSHASTEHARPEGKLQTYIWKMLRSNLTQDTGYLDRGFHGFPQFLQANARMAPQLGHDSFLPSPFQFIIHPTIQHCIASTPLHAPPAV